MLHPSISRNGITVNGIYPTQFGTANEQLDPTSFRANQGETLAITHSESFSLRAYLKGSTALSFGVSVNTINAQASDVVDAAQSLSVADGVVSFSGAADGDITIGVGGKPLVGPGLFTIYNFLPLIGKEHSLVLSLSKNKALYLLTIQASTLKIFTWVSNAWALAQTITNPQAFTAGDIISFRVSNEKIDVEIGNTSVWNKPRSWSIALSSADLGTLTLTDGTSTIDPVAIPFGKSIPLVIGKSSGNYSLTVANQDGATFSVAQAIEVTTDSATAAMPKDDSALLQTLLVASLARNNAAATGSVVPTVAAETTDWRKIMTWGGLGLAGLLVVVAVVSLFRK